MRAFELKDYTGPDGLVLTNIDTPHPNDDEVLLRVHAVGVNYPDLLMTKGQYQNKPALPVVPGCEVAGTVISAPNHTKWHPGDRAAAFVWQGGFAEQVAIPLNSVVPIPDSVDFQSAAAMVVNYHTVHFALARRGAVQPGETVLVLGAAGGIGTAAVQVAKGLGARVIAGVSSPSRAETAAAAGAPETVVLEKGFAGTIREMTDGRGVDVVLDPVGDWIFDEAVRTLAPEGRLLVVGFAAGKIPELKVNRLLLRNIGVVGAAFGAFLELDHDLMTEQAASLDRMIADGAVKPYIGSRFGFEELPQALRSLDAGEIRGKAVVVIE
ncbi:NADPH:quinone oxidoreductase family protein [Rhodococcus pseudokoreensis]|uniref:NADPH:quinone oxidoreductase family protein n=1 Tax=Rhodococcus pseudokoreensis TaxID=2811421 RepID=A0A974ZUE4_9NOCA|nr:NADPH:quinone oxidoreductase family protein [Rhodococcus pseudokoreensis]QSE90669.1 NADPH:quinone oxidoreductase family protein [Rhodococcus pseudokoreensis]